MQPFMVRVQDETIPMGFELCEDLWCVDYRQSGDALNATKILVNNGARFIVNLSASPWTYGKNGARDRRVLFLREACQERFMPFLYVNCTGVQNNGKNIVTFDGGSTVYNGDGFPVRAQQSIALGGAFGVFARKGEADGLVAPRAAQEVPEPKAAVRRLVGRRGTARLACKQGQRYRAHEQ